MPPPVFPPRGGHQRVELHSEKKIDMTNIAHYFLNEACWSKSEATKVYKILIQNGSKSHK